MNKNQIEKLEITLSDWLHRHDLHHDTHFYTPDEWAERGEEFLTDSDLILVFENGLFDLINYYSHDPLYKELDDLIEGFGYYFELGHAWNMGFYSLEILDIELPTIPKGASYREKLTDQRWIKKREKVRDRAGNKCIFCGKDHSLEVHHTYYRYGWEPWEYPLDSLMCLCSDCHKERAKQEFRFRTFMPNLTRKELKLLRKGISSLLNRFEREDVEALISSFQKSTDDMETALSTLIENENI
ncbi:HNH endonuclease [Fodinibius sediminis]|uniref:HNH endonuclease n=1 Tax=Fodinibius sediminis TaxID=1214077 RepID=A0A521FK90_9BACT|nr:HNH endonuclease [Fodinibius sediminis]SMO96020.1 hypothetical protein SAMN06265218_1411 [Fodinibius sediminis]